MMSSRQEVKGNTLKVYLYLQKHGPSNLRDIQRGAELSSASLASYHLTKLRETGFVEQNAYGKYYVTKDSLEKVFAGYLKVGPTIVPQLFFFSLFFTILVAYFGFKALTEANYGAHLAIISLFMIAVFWFETVRLWRKLNV